MFVLSHKSKQKLLFVLKIFILGITFCYVFLKIRENEAINLQEIGSHFYKRNTIVWGCLFLFLASLNWFFEILKWKSMVAEINPISFYTSLQQSLSSLTISLSTPNRIGEYGAKAYFFEKEKRKDILLVTFFHNAFQMAVTVFFGTVGLLIIWQQNWFYFVYETHLFKIIIGGFLIGITAIFAYYFRKKTLLFKGLSFSKIYSKLKQISLVTKLKVLLFSMLRYVVFSSLFYLLLVFFGMSISLPQALPITFLMYLIASVIPSIFIFDVIVKGGVAVWLFSMAGYAETPVLITVFCMWILNFVIPAIAGSYYLFSYNPKTI